MFDGLPLKERLFVRGRLATAPLEALAARAEGARLLDVGCGHGVLVALLAAGSPGRHVVGIDPDGRMEQMFAIPDGYFTTLAFDDGGRAYVGTGSEGRVWRVSPDRTASLAIDVPERTR